MNACGVVRNMPVSGLLSGDFLKANDKFYLAVIVILALALRLPGLGDAPLWLDEAYSAWFTRQGWSYLWGQVPLFEPHPPLYYSLLKLWSGLWGDSAFSLRLLSVIASVLAIPFVYVAARLIAGVGKDGTSYALLTALLCACWPYQLRYAQDARPYAFVALAAAISFYCFFYIGKKKEKYTRPLVEIMTRETSGFMHLIGLGAGLALLMWFHNADIISVAVFSAVLFVWWAAYCCHDKHVFVALLFSGLAGLALYSPNFVNFLIQMRVFSRGFWLGSPDPTALFNGLVLVYSLPFTEISGVPALWTEVFFGVGAALLGGYGLSKLLAGAPAPEKRMMLLCVLVLAFGSCFLSVFLTFTYRPLFLPRTLISAQPALFLVLGAIPQAFKVSWQGFARAFLCLGCLAVGLGYKPVLLQTATSQYRLYPEIVKTIVQSRHANAPVFIFHNSTALPVEYYMARQGVTLDLHPIPGPYPSTDQGGSYVSFGAGLSRVTPDSVSALIKRTGPPEAAWLLMPDVSVDPVYPFFKEVMGDIWPYRQYVIGKDRDPLLLILYSKNPL